MIAAALEAEVEVELIVTVEPGAKSSLSLAIVGSEVDSGPLESHGRACEVVRGGSTG